MFERVGPAFKFMAVFVVILGGMASFGGAIAVGTVSGGGLALLVAFGGIISSVISGVFLAGLGSIVEAAEKYLDSNNTYHTPVTHNAGKVEVSKPVEEDIAAEMPEL